MARSFIFLPDGDIENDGWTIVGGSATSVWEVLRYYEDDCYVRCPIYRGGIEVKFPFDYSEQFPQGAIIDSITVMIKMKTASGSGARGVTMNVLSADNRSRYTTRTIYATSSLPADGVEVATYSKDPLGRAWDIHRLNKLRLRLFSQNNIEDSVRIYGLWVVVNFHTKPSVAITSPSGTVNTPSPTVSWTYTQEDGEPQKSVNYKVFTLQQTAASTFNPDTADPVFSATVNGIGNSYVLPTSLNNNDYKVYVRATSQHGAKSAWASKQFAVAAPSPGVPGDNNAGLSGIPGVGTPTVVPDNYTSSSAIRMTDTSNLLSVQQADFEIPSDPLGYVKGESTTTLERDVTQAFADGLASMKITSGASGTASAVSTFVEVYPGQPMTVRSQFRSGSTERTVTLTARFYDETWTLLPDTISDSELELDGTWVEVVATGTSPATAKYCEVVLSAASTASSEAHYVDHVGLMYGTNTAWSDGGHTSRNMLTSFLATGDDPVSAVDSWVSDNSATTMLRVDAAGTGAHGLKCNQMTCQTVAGTISIRAASTSASSTIFNSTTTGKNFTLYKPTHNGGSASAVQENDLMIAFVSANAHGTITPPTGWTAVNTASIDDGSTDMALWILKRTAGNADPASWATGTISVDATRRSAVVVAYSGAANASEQFLAEAVRTEANEPKVMQSATVVNTDPNAWRIAAFAASDNVSLTSSSMVANVTPPTTAAAITYVGKASAWQNTSVSSGITINKPSGVQSGDLMLAAVVISGNVTASQPSISGWTAVQKIVRSTGNGDDHSGAVTTMIYKRTAGSSEPNSWTGTISGFAGQPKISQVVAYRNCDTAANQFIDTDSDTNLNGSTIGTGTATNNNSKAWRVSIFGATTAQASAWLSGDSSRRTTDTTSLSGHPDTVLSFQDSNGMISTGNHSRTARMDYSDSYFAATGWIGILKPATSPPAAGSNETERVEFATGSSNPWTDLGVYDSNGGVAVGQHSVYGILTTSDTQGANAMASWIGLIKPNGASAGGTVAAAPSSMIDIDSVDESILTLAGRKLTMMADFKGGNAAGTPALTAEFYRADQLIGSQSAAGRPFDTSGFTKSWAVFDIPAGTTRIKPVLSALDRVVSDTVHFDRAAVMLGALADPTQEPQWRNGTARPEHPVWARPVIQYQENDGTGYGDWKLLAGQKALPPQYDLNTSQMFYVDHTIVPLNSRRYRVATLSYGLNGDFFSSGYGPASGEAIFEPRSWWLKDIQDLSKNMQVSVRWKDQTVDTSNMTSSFQPLGADFPVVITEGFKGDSFGLEIHCEQVEFTALMDLLNSGRTLILQSDIDKMWWVRPIGNISANILATGSRQERPRRYVSVTFIQVAPEE